MVTSSLGVSEIYTFYGNQVDAEKELTARREVLEGVIAARIEGLPETFEFENYMDAYRP